MKTTRDTFIIMKGLAILFIAIHNLVGLDTYDYAKCNEMNFEIARTLVTFNNFKTPTFKIIGDFISFICWFGVPVFVFLSGYGLSKKYEKMNFSPITYIKHSYTKLLILVLPAAVYFSTILLLEGNYYRLFWQAISLTFLNGLFRLPAFCPTYWYFSLTFQLYLCYILFRKVKSKELLLVIALVFLIMQGLVSYIDLEGQVLLSYMRHNFIGWIPVFVLGIVAAKVNLFNSFEDYSGLVYLVICFLCIVLSYALNINFYLWLLLPFVSIVFFYCLSLLVESTNISRKFFIWYGKLSSYIFVAHPIAVLLINDNDINIVVKTFIYIILFTLLSVVYKYIVNFTKRFINV